MSQCEKFVALMQGGLVALGASITSKEELTWHTIAGVVTAKLSASAEHGYSLRLVFAEPVRGCALQLCGVNGVTVYRSNIRRGVVHSATRILRAISILNAG